jgi:hypothetical protein
MRQPVSGVSLHSSLTGVGYSSAEWRASLVLMLWLYSRRVLYWICLGNGSKRVYKATRRRDVVLTGTQSEKRKQQVRGQGLAKGIPKAGFRIVNLS